MDKEINQYTQLTLSLMLIFLLPQKTQGYVVETLNLLSEKLGIERFQKLFPVILADRGVEFLNAEAIECDQWVWTSLLISDKSPIVPPPAT
jgi:hypothetical protein